MASKLFKRGYETARKEIKKQEARSENNRYNLWQLFLNDGDEVRVRFLTEEPLNLHTHSIKKKGKFLTYRCTDDDDCGLCDSGEYASFKGAYLVYDYREWKDNKGKKHSGNLRLYLVGARVLAQLDRLHTKYGLSNRDYIITRAGSDKSTTYMFDREEEKKLSPKKIEQLLGDLAEDYNGTADSLYDILDKVLLSSLPVQSIDSEDVDDEDDEDLDEDYDEEVDMDDEDEDDDDFVDDEDEDEEDYSPPTKRRSASPVKKKSAFKRRR